MNREEAIKIVKSHYPANKQMLNEALEFLIPELKESEDEKIRKDLITFLDEIWHLGKNANFDKWDKCDCSNWIAWVNKQSEHEYTLKSSNMLDASKLTDQITKLAKDYDFNLPNRSYDIYAFAKDILAWIEKEYKKSQGKSALEPIKEENVDNANKVESTFKVGDWIITSENKVLQITSIEDTRYRFNNESSYWEIYYCDKECRLWTIEDAKEGDVLYAKGTKDSYFRDYIFNFSSFTEDNVISTNFGYDVFHGTFDTKLSRFGREEDFVSVTPATKEQRDLLSAKMKEAGYEWVNNCLSKIY